MKATTRDRLVLPILMPVTILVVIGVVLFGFSRILLSVTHNGATSTALIVAFGIVVTAGVVASRAVVKPANLASMVGAVLGVAMLAGGIALAALAPSGSAEGGAGGPAVTVNLVAKGIAFQQTSLSAPAGQAFAIAFDNQDSGIQHDVVIYDNQDFSGDPVFQGDIVTGPNTVTYDVPALDAGTYYFHCSIHPQMQGKLAVAGGGGSGGGGGVNIVAEGIKFDTTEIDLPAGSPSTIHFENKDAGVQHNIAIFPSETELQNPLFRGEIVTGPDSIDYQVPALDPGTYYFHCDIHPTMNGKVVVAKGSGGGATPSAGSTPTGGPTPTASPSPGGGGATTSTVVAEGIRFDTAEIHLPANQAVTLTFQNNDAGVQHDIAIFPSETDLQNPLFRGDIVTGPDSIDYQIPALQPGTYYFHCDVHPTMNGAVIVG